MGLLLLYIDKIDMSKHAKEYRLFYPIILIAALILLFLASGLIERSDKPKEDFQNKIGYVT